MRNKLPFDISSCCPNGASASESVERNWKHDYTTLECLFCKSRFTRILTRDQQETSKSITYRENKTKEQQPNKAERQKAKIIREKHING